MKRLAIVVSALVTWSTAPAGAETTACTEILALPVTLNVSGIYCLKSHLSTGKIVGNIIRITRDNIVLDLNGFRLFGNKRVASLATGVYALDRKNIVIRNGTIEGFYRGIYLDDDTGRSANHLVENIRAIDNGFAGIQVEGENLVVRNNQVMETGPNDDTFTANGIFLQSFKNARVSGNTVSDTSETTTARGIFAITGSEIVIEKNVVTDTNTATATYAIHVQSVNRASIINNQLLNQISATTGIRAVSSTGISCINNVIDSFNITHSTCNTIVGTQP